MATSVFGPSAAYSLMGRPPHCLQPLTLIQRVLLPNLSQLSQSAFPHTTRVRFNFPFHFFRPLRSLFSAKNLCHCVKSCTCLVFISGIGDEVGRFSPSHFIFSGFFRQWPNKNFQSYCVKERLCSSFLQQHNCVIYALEEKPSLNVPL